MRPLTDIESCFQGVIPSYLATRSASGEPNVTAISIVHLLSPQRVGISCQFMNKTLTNLRATGQAQLLVLDPMTLRDYLLDARFERMVDSGPVFSKMAATLDAVASQSGMAGVFALSGVAEFEVLDWRPAGSSKAIEGSVSGEDPIARLDRVSAAIESATDLDTLFDLTFTALSHELGLEHGFLLLVDGSGDRLYTIASRGFDHARFGAEISVGEGVYGMAAARKTSIRTGSMSRERLMAQAVARESEAADPTHLPLPGLSNAESALAIPLVRGDRCIGVLGFQSERPGAFTDACERSLLVVARQLAAMMGLLAAPQKDIEVSAKRGPVGGRALVTRVKYFESDGSVFFDDEYLIKGVAGRILWRVLSNYSAEHRDEFSSKEIRLDPDIGLPAIKDNLEARLIALRERLLERSATVRIEKAGRGRFRLEVMRELVLERRP